MSSWPRTGSEGQIPGRGHKDTFLVYYIASANTTWVPCFSAECFTTRVRSQAVKQQQTTGYKPELNHIQASLIKLRCSQTIILPEHFFVPIPPLLLPLSSASPP